MALVNHAKKEINAKIVYFGPEWAGKATNLTHIFGKLKESFRGTFKSMNLQNDRMLFFDFVPSGQGALQGYTIRFHIYTITGEASHASSWKMVLKGVDGVVFVADSDPARMPANQESLRLLQSCLGAYGKSLSDLPFVLQCNKRDLAGPAPLDAMREVLDLQGVETVPAASGKGEGVLESIFTLVKGVMKSLRGGVDLDRQAEQLDSMTRRTVQESRRTLSIAPPADVEEEGVPVAAPGTGQEVITPSVQQGGGEPVVEFAGEPEILRGGMLRLPLSIRFDGKEKKIALDISLFQDRD